MTAATTAPAGRVYGLSQTDNIERFIRDTSLSYARAEGRIALWLRCNPADHDRFVLLWPGAVVADRRVQRGTVMLGREG